MALREKAERFMKEKGLLKRHDRVLAAVSGGPDSMALLHLLHSLSDEWELTLAVVHVNHMIRGQEADEEAELVRHYAASLGVDFHLVSVNIPAVLEQFGGNLQDAARVKRHEALSDLAKKQHMHKAALAHHADDQAETYLMRMIKGSSPAGLRGMEASRTINGLELIRPLLRVYKEDILQYCHQHEIPYRIDSSNENKTYMRNRIRLELIPYLQRMNPRIAQVINQTAQLLQEDEQYMEQEAVRWMDEHVHSKGRSYQLKRDAFRGLHIALQRRVIKLILSYLSAGKPVWDFHKLERLRMAIASNETRSRRVEAGHNITCFIQYDEIRFETFQEPLSYEYKIHALPERLELEGASLTFSVLSAHEFCGESADCGQAWFDLDEIHLPFTIRTRRPGDRMQPKGMSGSKKVKDIFIDEKVRMEDRDKLPLLFDGQDRLLWIPTVRRSKFALITSKTKRILHIVYEKNNH